MDSILIYALTIYFWFHLVSQSDLFARPRAWWVKTVPGWISYPTSCAFCFTWWSGVLLTLLSCLDTGVLWIDTSVLFVAPVINHLVSLLVSHLRGDSKV